MCSTFRYFLLSITLLAAVYASPSNPIPKTAGIEAGTVLYATASMNSINVRNIPLSWVAPNTQVVQSSATMVHFSNHSNANGFDYMLNTKFVPSTRSLMILFVFRYIGWANICVSYIATTNPSIFTSSFLINTLDTIDCSVPATSVAYTTLVPNWQPVNTSQILIIAVFISGIRTSNTNLYITLNILFDESTGKLTSLVNFNSQTPNVEILKLGYLIVLNSPTTMFTFLTPTGSMPGGDINFVETAGVVAQSIVLRTIQFYNDKFYCQGPNCTSIYVNSFKCTALGGNLLDKYCIICQPDQVWRRNSCLCQPNYFLYLGVCKACPSGVTPTYNLTVCVPTNTNVLPTSIPSSLTSTTRSQLITKLATSSPPKLNASGPTSAAPTIAKLSSTVASKSAPVIATAKAKGKK